MKREVLYMGINEEGFLSKDINVIEKDILQKQYKYFDFGRRINLYCHSLKFKLDIHREDAQRITASTLYVSLLESFNAIYILISKGLIVDSNILLRGLMEKTLRLKYISISYDNTKHYHLASEKERLKLFNSILNAKEGVFSQQIKSTISKEERDELKKKIELEGIKELPSNEELANMTGLEMIYQNAYRILNSYVHTNATLINKFLKMDKDGMITDINWFSHFTDISSDVKQVMFSTLYLILTATESIIELFELETDELFKGLTKELEELTILHNTD
jgi:Family of unknown function (DUF5677)